MDMDVQSYLIGHLGIVAGIFDALRGFLLTNKFSSNEHFSPKIYIFLALKTSIIHELPSF